MDGSEAEALVEEMEQLRQELHRLLDEQPESLASPKACALSARLDLLIMRYMDDKLKSSAAGN